MVQVATADDICILAEMAKEIWGGSKSELARHFKDAIADRDSAVFLKREEGVPVGFVQCTLRRDYVEGTQSSPVGYLEGIFVRNEFRKRGYARQLLYECEVWARAQGCSEFASDCELQNCDSLSFHIKVGFSEANRIICFKKML